MISLIRCLLKTTKKFADSVNLFGHIVAFDTEALYFSILIFKIIKPIDELKVLIFSLQSSI